LPIVPSPSEGGASEKSYRLVYAVHELLDPTAAQQEGEEEEEEEEEESTPTRFIGLINLRSLDKSSFALPAHLFPPCTLTNPSSILTVELGYLFLPVSWSRGFATESVTAVLRTCRGAPGFWEPYTRVYVRAVVSVENSGSLKVVEKIGMEELGVHEWKGEKAWFAGMWRDRLEFGIWGTWM
jgi:RimJ/RimL family protein N-acetyltransferase